ncbi:RNA-binding S4 domain-containing protein [Vibrio hangzhouensis]|uniref:Ribosome-associated protein n=1 Tax=Vibrio hangzhouensis TaxID=462991 RepID=A0A1H5WQX6_9VIBR|nr:RNA-binding S4 domain-containing protein [Vibrio hangzhouensis]SEG01959.1 ribosome-associated protein [Vibrio hangzhouensis]
MNQEFSEEHYDDEEIEIEAIGIEVSSHPIELYKLFKVANLVGGGGEAKHLISEGYVAVNGELETRKRRKMYDGDFFEFNQEYYVVVCDQPPIEPAEASIKKTKNQPDSTGGSNKSGKKKNSASKKNRAKQSKDTDANNRQKASKPKDPNSGRGGIDFF